jgi:hypothetical protein
MKLQPTFHLGLVGLALLLAVPARAGAPSDDANDRERIRSERAAAEAEYSTQMKKCNQQFVVTSCVNEARAKRHALISRLDEQQHALDQAERARRASERTQSIDSKVGGDEASRREEAARERATNRPAGKEPKPVPAPAGAAPRAPRAASSPAQRAEQEENARLTYEKKQRDAEAHRQEVERRNQEHARKTRPAAPLPMPAAAQAASAAQPKGGATGR